MIGILDKIFRMYGNIEIYVKIDLIDLIWWIEPQGNSGNI